MKKRQKLYTFLEKYDKSAIATILKIKIIVNIIC